LIQSNSFKIQLLHIPLIFSPIFLKLLEVSLKLKHLLPLSFLLLELSTADPLNSVPPGLLDELIEGSSSDLIDDFIGQVFVALLFKLFVLA